ncbi:transcription antitermination factor NusB [Zhouia amylolytica AD3]|uniref:Transcription antitermination factor NusB n=2 Tax=Zhouia amylolytica TaxID=376730 RepID=W2UTZ5_9FLAO|nr:transcription antitermination factor NusB [Zhouia amylolytica AD3]MCQ0110149.1 transcription antitermination factor NusB [Zhouia amylolytica]
MQSIYAIAQSGNADVDKEVKFVKFSMDNMYNLYLTLLALLVEVQKKAEEQQQLSQKKYLATQEEKNPNKKFVNNSVLKLLVENELLTEELSNRKLSWDLDDKYVEIIYDAILASDIYQEYMSKSETNFKEDREFVIAIYKNIIAPNDKLYDFIEDRNLTWVDDLPLVNTLILKMITNLKKDPDARYFLPSLYKDEDDLKFASDLFKKTVLNYEKLQEEIVGKTPNWDVERIADLDSILLKMAICEFLRFPSIPVKVTMNEYVEIAKEYSTPKSSVFINGILDKLVKEYQQDNKLNKVGRGLM